jgi:hypothetical protein
MRALGSGWAACGVRCVLLLVLNVAVGCAASSAAPSAHKTDFVGSSQTGRGVKLTPAAAPSPTARALADTLATVWHPELLSARAGEEPGAALLFKLKSNAVPGASYAECTRSTTADDAQCVYLPTLHRLGFTQLTFPVARC